jgi:ferritin-like metal-binding protein YciE
MTDLKDLLKHELDDLYSAEKQITKALPKLARAATSPMLRQAFEHHLAETEQHVARLEQVFAAVGLKPGRRKCEAMAGLLKEGDALIKERPASDVLDAALIGAAQRVEHYEIAGYGCARTYLRVLGHGEAAMTLQKTLDEEGQADKKLTKLAEGGINIEAADGDARGGAMRRNGGGRSNGRGTSTGRTTSGSRATTGSRGGTKSGSRGGTRKPTRTPAGANPSGRR